VRDFHLCKDHNNKTKEAKTAGLPLARTNDQFKEYGQDFVNISSTSCIQIDLSTLKQTFRMTRYQLNNVEISIINIY
jgi:hypothetical protein